MKPPPPPTPVVTITGGNAITEGGSARFTLTATPAPLAPLDVSVSIRRMTAISWEGARTVAIPGTVSFTDGGRRIGRGQWLDLGNREQPATRWARLIRLGDGERDDEPPPPPLPSEYINFLSNQGIAESQLQQDLDPDFDGVPNGSTTQIFLLNRLLAISSTPYNALQYVKNPNAGWNLKKEDRKDNLRRKSWMSGIISRIDRQ